MSASLRVHLPGDERAPGIARRELREWLEASDCAQPDVDDMELVVSELVTNAVTHADSASTLVVANTADRLRMEVHDHSPVAPQRRSPSGVSGGFGLNLVARLTDAWGWTPQPLGGKAVWVEVAC